MKDVLPMLLCCGALMASCSKKQEAASPSVPIQTAKTGSTAGATIPAPGLGDRNYVAPLADSYSRIDPSKDGWETETFTENANRALSLIAKLLQVGESAELAGFIASDFQSAAWFPEALPSVYQAGPLQVWRRKGMEPAEGVMAFQGWDGLSKAAKEFRARLGSSQEWQAKFKLYRLAPAANGLMDTRILLQAKAAQSVGSKQVDAMWDCQWSGGNTEPKLRRIALVDYEESHYAGPGTAMFEDCTESLLGHNPCYREQFLLSTDYWRARLPMDLGLDVVANHGLALGDVNGDLLDDIYICQQGGLPNRLFLRQADGTLKDISKESGTNWLDYCASALFVDFDNDGDKDLLVGQEWRVLFMSNDGKAKFTLEFGLGTHAQTFSLAAADYDQDGDVDVFVCGYNPSASSSRQGRMGEPMPFHDAQNGGRNMMLQNRGGWEFQEVTNEVGLGENNNRFSFAAAWEDYDNDGDLDLYVANDYGRNNLYRQDNGKFHDVAAEMGVEDMASGMSISWGDYNRDGRMDAYISNMFSTAGNRITYQRQFKTEEKSEVKGQFQRFARGNSLFENTGHSPFKDVSETANVTLGRWAWASKFLDMNNDGWEDLLVANGFITTEDSGDL